MQCAQRTEGQSGRGVRVVLSVRNQNGLLMPGPWTDLGHMLVCNYEGVLNRM